jgi:LSD1 subclass zinc finger protein
MTDVLFKTQDGELIKCKDCRHTWFYTGANKYALCNQCQTSNIVETDRFKKEE